VTAGTTNTITCSTTIVTDTTTTITGFHNSGVRTSNRDVSAYGSRVVPVVVVVVVVQ
jgi:hypothetical protein